jgi:uncharacterized protein DUF3618
MTTSKRTGEAAPRQGASAAQEGAAATAPSDQQELEREIERTRGQLGETVEQLVAKTDVKSRAQAKANELSGALKAKVGQTQQRAAHGADSVRGQLAGPAATAQQRVTAAAGPVWEATPEPVRQAVAKGARTVKQRRVPLAAGAAGLLIVSYLLAGWRRTRR